MTEFLIRQGKDPGREIERLLVACLQGAVEQSSGQDSSAAVHGLRKATKKARALLWIVQATVGTKDTHTLYKRVRNTSRALATSRDIDVAHTTLANILGPEMSQQWAQLLPPVQSSTPAGRSEIEAANRRMLAVAGRIKEIPWKNLEVPGLLNAYKRAYREARAPLAVVLANPDSEALHDWRKEIKRLWYCLRLLQTRDTVITDRVNTLKELQSTLGEDHDLAELRKLLLRNGWDERLTPLMANIGHRRGGLLARALHLSSGAFEMRPRQFRKHIRPLMQ